MAAQMLLKGPSDQRVELKERLIAGRNPDSDIVLEQGHPSRRHAQITLKDGSVWLEDLGSANGTFVNERRIQAPVELKLGDRIRFDVEIWELIGAGAAEPPKTVVRGAPAPDVPKTDQAKATPGSWVYDESKGGPGTRLIDPDELKNMLRSGGAAAGAPALDDIAGAHLRVKSGKRAGEILRLSVSASENVWTIGSDAARDIAIPDDGVSAYHATLRHEGARWKLTDQMSANGTFVDGTKISVHFLSTGDHVVRFGPVECDLHLPAGGRQDGGGQRRWWVTAVVSFIATAVVLAAVWWLMAGR